MERNPMEKGAHKRPARSMADISKTVYLTKDNASFFMKNGFLHLRFEEREERVQVLRAFPFELEWEFLSVLNESEEELGLIRNLDDFEGEARELLKAEIERRYYSPILTKILKVKEKYGFSYWKAESQEGEVEFTLRDAHRNILRAEGNRVILLDVNGNRFQIPDVTALDRRSYQKIELYL